MANKKKKKHKQVFHKPETIGERTHLKMTPLLITLSLVSLAVQLGGSIFAVWGYTAISAAGYSDAAFLLVLPVVMWVLTIVARLGFRFLPLDMWRMPIDVRSGMVKCDGWLLKLVTLLVELESAVALLYVNISLYLGAAPLEAVMLVWLAALAVSVWLPCRRAGKLGRGELTWGKSEAGE